MGFFRSQNRSKEEASNNGIQSPTSFDTVSKDGSKSIDGELRPKVQRFNFLKSNSNSGAKLLRVFGGSTPETVSATPSSGKGIVNKGSNNNKQTNSHLISPESTKSTRPENYTLQTAEDTSSTSLSSMLDTLKILAVSDQKFVSPKNVSMYQDVEVTTPESRHLLLQQREVIRKILFDKNTETNDECEISNDDDVYVDHLISQVAEDEEYSDDYEDDDDDSDRTPSPPPPPPEGEPEGIEYYDAEEGEYYHDEEEEDEYYHLQHDNLQNQDLTLSRTSSSHSTTEVVPVQTGPNTSQQMKITVNSSLRGLSTPGQTPDRSMRIDRPTVATPLGELTPIKHPSIIAETTPDMKGSIIAETPTDMKGLPEDENHYYEMLRGNFDSPIPDDERMEYTKDEMLETRTGSSHTSIGKLKIVERRERQLTGGTSNEETPLTGSDGIVGVPGKTVVERSTGVDKHLFEPISSQEIDEYDYVSENNDPRNISVKQQTMKDRNNNIGIIEPGINSTNSYLCHVADPNAVTQNIMQALNCVGGGNNDNTGGNQQQQPLGAMGILQEKVKSRWNISSKMSMSYGADNNSVVVKKSPSFVYTTNDESTDRFLRRITNYGFVLLFLQAPGSLGNSTEDWNGRTVTMTIEKGVISTYPTRTPLSASSGYSSVTWSTRTGSNNSISSIKSMTPPIVKHPRLQWMSVAGGLTTGVSTTSVDLLNIQAVSAFGDDTEKDVSTIDNNHPSTGIESSSSNELCFFTVTTSDGIVHMFEATSRDERNRIVKGLRCIIARLSFHLISGNPVSVSELYCNLPTHHLHHNDNNTGSPKKPTTMTTITNGRQTLPTNPVQSDISRLTEEMQSEEQPPAIRKIYETPNPSDIMDRVAHVFLDI
jgi:hypothetical protein